MVERGFGARNQPRFCSTTIRSQQAEHRRKSIVAPAPHSTAALRKDHRKRTDDAPVHSFRTLLEDLGTLTKNRGKVHGTREKSYLLTQPARLQAHHTQQQ